MIARRFLFFMVVWLTTIGTFAQRGQDFASRFMQECKGDTAVHCVTISPKMMEQLTRQPGTNRNEHIIQAIEKLKSARIITANVHGEGYYQLAENLLKKNSQRFQHDRSYHGEHTYGAFYSRKLRNGQTVELIMIHANTKMRSTIIVNLTGDIDQEFINSLTKSWSGRTAKL